MRHLRFAKRPLERVEFTLLTYSYQFLANVIILIPNVHIYYTRWRES